MGMSWLGAELVWGRVGLGPSWLGTSWFGDDLARKLNSMQRIGPKVFSLIFNNIGKLISVRYERFCY